jgi:ABC-2 type transport system ATP-binding protein
MTAVLQVSGLHKWYGRTHAVDDVSFTVNRGDVFGLLGPNGSGKTTTISCALGLLRADEGRITVLGEPASAIQRTGGRVAVVFDAPTLVDGLTCEQNLRYARRTLGHDGGRKDDDALQLVGLASLAERRAGRLSLGQRRRLSIARALIGRPELLVLDEPLSGLDTVGVRGMLDLFRRLAAEGLTLVVCSHRLHEIQGRKCRNRQAGQHWRRIGDDGRARGCGQRPRCGRSGCQRGGANGRGVWQSHNRAAR